MFEFNESKQAILHAEGNLLIMGGPGSGKTTIALFKAKQIIESGFLKKEQKILFLSFARATISRVEQQAGGIIPKEFSKCLEINTYHGFTWGILKNHGYLLNPKLLHLLPPHEAASRLAGIDKLNMFTEINKLFAEEGLVHFDLFACKCEQLLSSSNALRKIISDVYPVIILDEFQDTNADEWNLISVLGEASRLIALADPDQRIYDFRGADPARIGKFIESYHPISIDFGTENNRSTGTDIVQFGNDLLSQRNKGKCYNNVDCILYEPRYDKNTKHSKLKYSLLQACQRVFKNGNSNCSVAVLTPSNSLMIEVSDFLSKEQRFNSGSFLPSISHEVALDTAGPALAGVLISSLLETGSTNRCTEELVISSLCEHILGRKGGNQPNQADLTLNNALSEYIKTKTIQGKNRKQLVSECSSLAEKCNSFEYSGNVISDWIKIRSLLDSCNSELLKTVASDARYLRLLKKGSMLHSSLCNIWSNNQNYDGATTAVTNALTQEHFATTTRVWNGVNVMTIHKAKGKEFDEVIIYEGIYNGKIVTALERMPQARLNLRVAVTRARNRVTILTPKSDPCPLL